MKMMVESALMRKTTTTSQRKEKRTTKTSFPTSGVFTSLHPAYSRRSKNQSQRPLAPWTTPSTFPPLHKLSLRNANLRPPLLFRHLQSYLPRPRLARQKADSPSSSPDDPSSSPPHPTTRTRLLTLTLRTDDPQAPVPSSPSPSLPFHPQVLPVPSRPRRKRGSENHGRIKRRITTSPLRIRMISSGSSCLRSKALVICLG